MTVRSGLFVAVRRAGHAAVRSWVAAVVAATLIVIVIVLGTGSTRAAPVYPVPPFSIAQVRQ